MLRERKYFRGEQSPFINKTLCLIIIKRTIETNIFLKNRTKKIENIHNVKKLL